MSSKVNAPAGEAADAVVPENGRSAVGGRGATGYVLTRRACGGAAPDQDG